MNSFTIICLFLSADFLLTECSGKAGVKVRLTRKGIKYALDFSKDVMENELMKKTLTTSGNTYGISYKLKNTKITEVDLTNSKLSSIRNVGLSAEFPGILLKARGTVWYRFTSGWIPISDTVDVSVTVSNVDVSTVMSIIVTSDGRPDIEIKSCKAKVGDVNLHFHGSGFKTWIYNMFSPFVEKTLKDQINAMFCKVIRKKILEKVRPRLENFPVLKKFGKWAEIDYTLMQAPVFGHDYMDIYLKGEFRSLSSHEEKRLVPPSLFSPQGSDNEKMIYVWVSEYTFNTAGEVFNGYSKFEKTLAAWDDKVPKDIRMFLTTDKFKFAIPNLFSFPNLPMSVQLVPYKASKAVINEGILNLFLYAHATFSLKQKNGKIFEAFKLQVDIDTTGTIDIKNKELTGKITDFNYTEKVLQSNIGKIISPLNNKMFKMIIETVVISHVNSILAKGFPLPNLDNIDFQNTDVKLQKGAIRIGTDIVYKMD